ncbi:aldo/keto reductase [Corynebacterium lizhenjunii]|uniref:Aldo/keto reductase n=1 Tax=Corynebacterium lizhenjunii TaxID=2709394 RepID=A0A7T0KFQ6_9CORY|nr:aldo/keto reductase [Corynebacterium lizhenjunii]QPK79762.1 aldo/keto reductase [Corynebacterium lizhenjunii]
MSVPTVLFNDDREMPLLGLGTYKLRGQECERVIREAIEIGYRKFDTATLYKNEEAVGKALRDAIAAGDVTRDELFVTSKVWHDHHGAELAPQAFQESMDKLGLDYLDLYLIHWPWPQGGKFVETFDAIARLQGMGQIASIGVANFYEEVLDTLIAESGIIPVLNQVELHVGFSQPQLREYHRTHGIVTEAWSPLARGALLEHPVVQEIAAAHGASTGQVTLAYLIGQGISVIPKSAQRERLEENFRAAQVELSAEQIAALDAIERVGGQQEGVGRMFADPREFPGADA